MKLSSSTLCGCCFCCYCHCWLMMLLMVSSVVHVSPEMSTTTNPTNPTTTTTNKKYIKLYNNINNNNNYAYQSEMTEFIQLNNRKLEKPNRTNRKTVATTISQTPLSTIFSLPATLEVITTISDDDYLYKENNVKSPQTTTTTAKSARETFEHDTITTIATIQTTTTASQQQSLSSTRLKATTLQVATTTPNTIISTLTTTSAPVQIQMLQHPQLQSNLYDATTTLTATTTTATILAKDASKRSKRQFVTSGNRDEEEKEVKEDILYMYDNSIEQQDEVGELKTTTTTTNNYVADNSNALVPPTTIMLEPTTESFVEHETITKSLRQAKDYTNTNKFKKITTKYWNTDNNTKQKQQHNNESTSNTNKNNSSNIDNSSSNSENKNDFNNSNNNKQKKINTFSLNNHNQQHYDAEAEIQNNQIPQQQPQPQLQLQQNHLKTALKTTIENRTTTAFMEKKRTINFSPANATNTITYNSTQIPNNTNNNNNIYITTVTAIANTLYDSVSNLSLPLKEIIPDSNVQGNHLQIPTSSVATTTLRTPVTYTPLHQYNAGFNQLRRPALLHHNHHHRYTRQATPDDEQNDKCRMFVEGDAEKNELYSPDYPNDYPKNINCTRVITAPKGQIIRLDFRNSFHIEEKEECKFDFLEIRDGQYGFSNLIGKYCGTDFPPEITSKERYLWLHFHSDESIEYSGFTAVYEFIDRNRDAPSTDLNCTIERDGFEGFVNDTDVPPEIKETVIRNKIPLDCMWRIQVQEKWKIQVKFIEFKLAKPNDCETNFLDIFPEQTVMPLRVKNFCGSAGEGITSESNILHVRFYAEQSAITSTFSILYTAFRERGSSSCAEDEYDCEDATCIAGNLKCNGRSNCKFLWDEEGCKLEDNGQSEHMIIIITVFGLILGGMVITFLVNCVRKIMHDQKIIREHIRQSKESKLDEMGRNSKGRSRDNISIVSPRQKHSQSSLQILDDVSNRYYRELEMQTKGNFKEKDPSILRHDMIVQTSLCSTDDSSTTITEQTPPTAAVVGSSACDMGCQTRESLFATASLMRQKSKTPSMGGSQHTIEGVPPPPRFSTFGYDAAHIAPPPPPTVSTLSRRNMHLPQESLEMEQLPPPPPQQTAHTMTMMMPQQQQQQQQHHQPQQQQHQHLHHRPSQEICHHHHQHQQHLQKQTLPRHHQQQQQQQQQQHQSQHHQHMQQPQHHQHHTSSTTIPTNVAQIPAPGTAIVTAISTGSSGRQREQQQQQTGIAGVKGKQTKVDESKVFIDIRNSAPDVIIMTSH